MQFEQFVSVEVVSAFISTPGKEVLKLTREGKITGYPLFGKIRKRYRYRISEVTLDFARLRQEASRMNDSGPSDSPEKD